MAFGRGAHTVADGTSVPAHVDKDGTLQVWNGIPRSAEEWKQVDEHKAKEANPSQEQIAKAVQALRDYFRRTYGDKTAEEAFSDGPAAITKGGQQARGSSQPADPYDFARPKRGWRINPYPTDPSKFWGPEPEE
jgi:hypothetical protein